MTKIKHKIPKVNFVNSFRLQANYLCFLARQISLGFYPKHEFFIIPKLFSHPQTVYFPDFPYSSRFWRLLQKAKKDSIVDTFPKEAVLEVEKHLPSSFRKKDSLNPTQKLWQAINRQFWQKAHKLGLFSKELSRLTQITVLSTEFGTPGSFYYQKRGPKFEIFMTLRTDQHPRQLAFIILKVLLLIHDASYETKKWAEGQTAINFLLDTASFSQIFGKVHSVKKFPLSRIQESQHYLRKLGFNPRTPLHLINGDILINDKLARRYLSPSELALLKLLYSSRPNVVTNDRIGQTLWPNQDEKFSLWAITKLVQRLRQKIRLLGVKQEIILSLRGQGYSLI